MADRKTIYLPDETAAYLGDAQNGLSSRIAGIIRRYQRLCAEHRPRLSRGQWCAIADANNGMDDLLLGDHQASLMMMWANVADAIGLGEKWEIDQDALVATMRGWSFAEQVAAFEAVRSFWIHHEKSTDEAMRLAGMISASIQEKP